jgi:hypothetical protein
MIEEAEDNSATGTPIRDKEVCYMAKKMGVSMDEMRRILADSSRPPEEIERLRIADLPKP